jgi:hypothetical protein
MAEPTEPPKKGDPSAFDVRRWLVEITGVDGWAVQRTFTRRKIEFVATYGTTAGVTAEVTLQALRTANNASWELVAKAGSQVAGVVVPARTRISW